MSIPTQITKRNGKIVPWDQNRITKAILGAITEVAGEDKSSPSEESTSLAQEISDNFVQEVAKKMWDNHIPSVEEVQDLVELCIYRNGKFEVAKAYILYRAKHKELRFKSHDGSLMRDYLVTSKYARHIKELKRRETWEETITRVETMHLKHFAEKNLFSEIKEAFQAVKEMKILPSMRSLQFGGKAIEKNHARMFNCSFTHINRKEAFQETMWALLSGCGVGFSVQKHHIDQLPKLAPRPDEYNLQTLHHEIEDTIQGWGNALGELIQSYIQGYYVEFSYGKIRPKGAPLETSGGRAPGHLGLKKALENIRRILNEAAGRKLRPIEAYDILMFAAKAVLSGGVRRSATICIFSPEDDEMRNAKTGNWFETNLQRSASNNTTGLERKPENQQIFEQNFESQKEFGEPGFYFFESKEYGGNPCVEIGLAPFVNVTEENLPDLKKYGIDATPGETLSGFQMCNLTTINAKACQTQEDFYAACKKAAFIGTLQAAYTDIPYLGPITKYINDREALLGVSICGILENPKLLLQAEILQNGAKIIREENQRVASLIGINPAARTTCIKPEGTASLILNTSSGIHPHHAKRYFRRVEANRSEPPYNLFKSINPEACEKSVYSETDDKITFCIEASEDAILLENTKAIQFLEMVKLVQENWVIPGTAHEKFNPGLRHNVSNTTVVDDEDWEKVKTFIWENRSIFTGVSLLKRTGDKAYPQAPREAVKTPTDQAKWNAFSYKKVDYSQLMEEEDNTNLKEVVACAGGACEIV